MHPIIQQIQIFSESKPHMLARYSCISNVLVVPITAKITSAETSVVAERRSSGSTLNKGAHRSCHILCFASAIVVGHDRKLNWFAILEYGRSRKKMKCEIRMWDFVKVGLIQTKDFLQPKNEIRQNEWRFDGQRYPQSHRPVR